MTISRSVREAILRKIEETVAEKYYSPTFDEAAWRAIVARNRSGILDAADTPAFETAIQHMLEELTPKGLGLLSAHTPITPRNAINASFSVVGNNGDRRWVFQDVLPGGVADKAGIRPADVLLSIAGNQVSPSDSHAEPPFEMRARIPLTIARGGKEVSATLMTKDPKYKDNPYSEPTPITTSNYDGIAYMRVSLFPGKIGIDFANAVDSIFRGPVGAADRLIIDLRGNPGGGIGGLALMSYLTPARLPVGYSANRKLAQKHVDPGALPVFDKVPRSKLAIPFLAAKFLGKTSVFLYTEALGAQAYKGRTAILVNEHTTGAAEMLTQFAQENQLATIVGTKTPGRLVSRSATKLGEGYRLVIPVAAYISAKGQRIDGNGITPDVPVAWSYEDAAAGRDNQLETAQRASWD